MTKSRQELVRIILNSSDDAPSGEELVHLLLERKFSEDADTGGKPLTLGERMADAIAKFAGSWTFILAFVACLLLWIVVNTLVLIDGAFDRYPFILLNLILSCVAALQAPVIMMSQNRQEAKDRQRSQNDYKIDLKSEIIVEDIHQKLDQLLKNQEEIYKKLEELQLASNLDAEAQGTPAPAPAESERD
ncbi:MAG TPA: DUF1003 domain-containing protein [Clostridia bacterium]|nr:DUF1003 domain-containing protein [Clostridia bacterium]